MDQKGFTGLQTSVSWWLCERFSSLPFDPRQLGKGHMDEE
jgi:hypothetical protein